MSGDRGILRRAPLLLAVALLVGATAFSYFVRWTEPGSIMPWESAIAMEAMRLNAGLPLYESGHASHLYGPGLTVILAGIFRVIGLDLLGARMVFSILALGLVALLTWIFCRGRFRSFAFLAAALFLGANLRALFVFTTAQPDCVAALCGLGGLYLWITRRDSRARLLLALLLFLAAMFVKQTAAAFALIPIAHAILWRPSRRRFLPAILPAAVLVSVLVLLRFAWPAVFAGMVSTPGALRVYYGRSLPLALFLVGTFPLFFVGLGALLLRPRIPARLRWICSGLVVLIPICVWTTSKTGGSYNSFLFAYLAMIALVVAQLDIIIGWMNRLAPAKALLASSLFLLVIVCSFFFQFEKALPVLFARCGDDKYASAVAAARQIGAGVISPEDPTIAYRANGHFGRSLYFELDAHPQNGDWPPVLPEGLRLELAQARAVVQVHNYMPAEIFPRTLASEGFHPVAVPALEGSAYTIWVQD